MVAVEETTALLIMAADMVMTDVAIIMVGDEVTTVVEVMMGVVATMGAVTITVVDEVVTTAGITMVAVVAEMIVAITMEAVVATGMENKPLSTYGLLYRVFHFSSSWISFTYHPVLTNFGAESVLE